MRTTNNILDLSFIKLTAYIILLLILSGSQLYAQHRHHTDKVESEKRNIYGAMMDAMMADMHNISLGNTPDTAFLQQMIAHHQGALVMAEYEIAHGGNAEMIELAKSILAGQQSEIKKMKLWIKHAKRVSGKLPDTFASAMDATMDTMMKAMPEETGFDDTDRAFAAVMKPHHQAAVDMARIVLRYSKDSAISNYAEQLIATQQTEVNQMSNFLSAK